MRSDVRSVCNLAKVFKLLGKCGGIYLSEELLAGEDGKVSVDKAEFLCKV